MIRLLLGSLLLVSSGLSTYADEQRVPTARPWAKTRPEMKRLLEELKQRRQRIPLPEPSAEEVARLGEWNSSYEMRLRQTYLPAGTPSVVYANLLPPPTAPTQGTSAISRPPAIRDFTRNADEAMSLSYAFKTRLFWIVSRTNNCQYCLGHQEQKLSSVGMTDNDIAALDSRWEDFPAAEQAAFAYARLVTYEPHRLADFNPGQLLSYYNSLQILEMTMSVAWNNAINRWKEGTGVPQSQHGTMFFRNKSPDIPADRPLPIDSFLTPTSAEFESAGSQVAPVMVDPLSNELVAVSNRGPLESREQVELMFQKVAGRTARLPLVSEEATRTLVPGLPSDQPVPLWIRLLANFPNDGLSRVSALQAIDSEAGDLSPLLKAKISWIVARQDRAWYASVLAYNALKRHGLNEEEIFLLDGDWASMPRDQRALCHFSRQLAMSPIALSDEDFDTALEASSPGVVVQLVNYVAGLAYFDRVTEAAGLPAMAH